VFLACSIEFFLIFQKNFPARFIIRIVKRLLVRCRINIQIIILDSYYNNLGIVKYIKFFFYAAK